MKPVAPQIVASAGSYHHPWNGRRSSTCSSRRSSTGAERRDGEREHLVDLADAVRQRGQRLDHAHERHTRIALTRTCGPAAARRRSARRRVQADLLVRLAERRRQQGLARVLQPAGERDLAGVPRHRRRARGEHQRRLRLLHERAPGPPPSRSPARGRVARVRLEGGAEDRQVGTVHRRATCHRAPLLACGPVTDARSRAIARRRRGGGGGRSRRGPALARALIAARSENPGGTEDEAAAVAAEILAGLGADPDDRARRGGPARAWWRRSARATARTLAWNGHLDVVPAGTPDTWSARRWRDRRRRPADRSRRVRHEGADRGRARRGGGDPARRRGARRARSLPPRGRRGARRHPRHEGDAGPRADHPGRRIVGEPSELPIGLAERGGAWFTVTASRHGRPRLAARTRG